MTAAPNPALDAHAAAALQRLADIALPPPVAWWPQTWGWAVVAFVALLLAAWATMRWLRRRVANRYRREALAELVRLEAMLNGDAKARTAATAALPALLKRVALAAWPRNVVAPLSGGAWVAFLAGRSGIEFPESAARLLDDAQYRGEPIAPEVAVAFAAASRRWIERHRVST